MRTALRSSSVGSSASPSSCRWWWPSPVRPHSNPPLVHPPAVSWIKIGLGVLLLLVGLRDWRKRPRKGEEPTLPKWLTTIESITPIKSGGLGLLLSAVNPKNLLLLVGAGVVIAQEATTTGDKVVAMIVFIVIAISTVALPVILNLTMGDKARAILDSLNAWLKANNATVMAVLILVIGFVLVGKGISGFN